MQRSATAMVRARHRARRAQPAAASHGLWFPVDVSTASRATIGGMTGNNSCGTRSIRYGIMRDNVLAIDAILADGSEARFGEVAHNLATRATRFPSPWRGGVRGGRKPGSNAGIRALAALPRPARARDAARPSTSPTPSPRSRAASAAT